MSSPPRWRAAPQSVLSWRQWDGELVVFDQRSGDTHHLGAAGASTLRALIESPTALDIAALLNQAGEAGDCGDRGPLEAAEEVLCRLEAAGLVERDRP